MKNAQNIFIYIYRETDRQTHSHCTQNNKKKKRSKT